MAETGSKVRLFHKSIRYQQPLSRPPPSEKPKAKSTPSVLTVPPSAKAAPQRSSSKEGKLKAVFVGENRQKSPGLRLRKPKTLNASLRSSQSVLESFANSQEASPRGSMLTLEAINLELKLGEMLAQIEELPVSERTGKRLKAFLDTLEGISRVDSVYGPVVRRITAELVAALSAAKIPTISELHIRNASLNAALLTLKTTAKQERESCLPRERLLENLNRENTLLSKKCEELEGLRKRGWRKNEGRELNDLRQLSKKLKELDEEVRAARVRESKLTDLLSWMQADSSRSSAYGTEDDLPQFPVKQSDSLPARPALVPPLCIPAPDCSPQVDSALNKAFEWSASTGTGALKSPPGSLQTGERFESM